MAQVTRRRILAIYRRLLATYGEPDRPGLDPVSETVCTILSQNTNDANRDRAYNRLRERFPTWEAVRDAPLAEVEETIRPAGLQCKRRRASRRRCARSRPGRGS